MLTLGEADAALSGGQKDCACGGAFRHRWLGQRRTGGAAYPGRCALEARPGRWGWSIGAAAGGAARRGERRPSAGVAVKGQRGQVYKCWDSRRGGCESLSEKLP